MDWSHSVEKNWPSLHVSHATVVVVSNTGVVVTVEVGVVEVVAVVVGVVEHRSQTVSEVAVAVIWVGNFRMRFHNTHRAWPFIAHVAVTAGTM